MFEVKEHEEWEVECIGEFDDEYVYDIEMGEETNHTFFANDILIHNSVYLTFDKMMDKLGIDESDDEQRLKVTRFLAKVAMNKLEEFNETFFEDKFHAKNSIFWDQELIARTGIWSQPKKYVCHILEENGQKPKHDMLVKGLDLVRSSISVRYKKEINDIVGMILKGATPREVEDYLKDLSEACKKWPIADIAIPSSCNNLQKYQLAEGKGFKFRSGSPQHMKGAVAYNYLLKDLDLPQLEPIKEKDKFYLLLLKGNLRYPIDSVGYLDELPEEFGLADYVDRDGHFERGVIKPLTQIYNAISWKFPSLKNKTQSMDEFFS